tara:strand:+ start:748 stop:894 length:147 start_codon:yes stop_codon:yes gene_type:complete
MKYGQSFYGKGKYQPETTLAADWTTVIDNVNSFQDTNNQQTNTWNDVQ